MQARSMQTYGSITLLLLAVWTIMCIRLDAPWFGAQDSTRLWVEASILNMERYGVENTKLMIVRDLTPVTTGKFAFYSHHPPLSVWIPLLLTRFVGVGEWSIRYASIVMTLISTAAMYALARMLYGRRMAVWATFFYACTPMILYMGRVPWHDGIAPALVFSLVFVRWLKKPSYTRYLTVIVTIWWCAWTGWPAVFFVTFMGLAGMWLGTARQRQQIVLLGILTAVAVITLMLFYQLQWDQSIESILDAFLWRASNASGRRNTEAFTLVGFFGRMFIHIAIFISLALLILSVWGIPLLQRHGSRFSNTMLLGLFASGMAYQLVFRNASYIHEYYKAFLLPSIAIAAAASVVYVRYNPSTRWILRPVIDGLLVTVVIPTLFIVLVLHLSGNRDDLRTIIDIINSRAQSDTVIASNLVRSEDTASAMPVEFYTYRLIRWGVSPQHAVDLATESGVFYFYCGEPTEALNELQDKYVYQTIDEDECWFFDFEGIYRS